MSMCHVIQTVVTKMFHLSCWKVVKGISGLLVLTRTGFDTTLFCNAAIPIPIKMCGIHCFVVFLLIGNHVCFLLIKNDRE